MAGILRNLVQACQVYIAPAARISPFCLKTAPSLSSVGHRSYSRDPYDPYVNFDTPSPYKERKPFRRTLAVKQFTGGVLPRPDAYKDTPLPVPNWNSAKKDQWVSKKALFGQNDYIDILGDGTIEPSHLLKGPLWLRGFKGNELQRLIRRKKFQGSYMRDNYPMKFHNVNKRIFFLYKRYNMRRRTSYWGSRRVAGTSRIERIKP